ncbi:MAG: hypothetical protein WA843_04760 [Candidatus Saccharimonadales bacterium]
MAHQQTARERSSALDALWWESAEEWDSGAMQNAVKGAPVQDIRLALSVSGQILKDEDSSRFNTDEKRQHGVLAVTSLLAALREAGYELPEELDVERVSAELPSVLDRGTVMEEERYAA